MDDLDIEKIAQRVYEKLNERRPTVEQNSREWTLVTNGLPKVSGRYFVCVAHRKPNDRTVVLNWDFDHWRGASCLTVIAWMPLPAEPPLPWPSEAEIAALYPKSPYLPINPDTPSRNDR
jgi:hypothetical protein